MKSKAKGSKCEQPAKTGKAGKSTGKKAAAAGAGKAGAAKGGKGGFVPFGKAKGKMPPMRGK